MLSGVCGGGNPEGFFSGAPFYGGWSEDGDERPIKRLRDLLMDHRLWAYLQSWIVLPTKHIATEREFWEIFLELIVPKTRSPTLLCNIDYGLMDTTWDQMQTSIIDRGLDISRMSVFSLEQSITEGLRDKDLREALLDVFQMWMFEGPDL
ncbi:hypothetical protein DL96DRAFT_1712047 [Flagelloscypha sp. PMI_526]|nr:hypothetical protein DL96DRAFT_1712047 [Flagelloscypha sp. PMI_526]